MMRYMVVVERGATSWGAHVPDLPGCIAVGETRAEVLQLIREAIEFHIAGLRQDGQPVPAPSSEGALAEQFPASSRPAGSRMRWQVVRFGAIPEAGVTNLISSPKGLYVYAGLLYRSFRPPILIPWPVIAVAREVRELWWKRYEVTVAGKTTIRMSRRAYRVIEPFLAANDCLTSRSSGLA